MGRRIKIERFKISSFKNASGSRSWRVVGTQADGIRVRQNFQDQTQAIEKKAELEGQYAGAITTEALRKTVLTPLQLSDAEAAVQAYPWGSLADVASHYRRLEERAAAIGVTIDDAVRYAESHYRPDYQETSILEARNQFINSRQGLRPRTLVHYEFSTRYLLEPDPQKPIHKFTVVDIEQVLGRFKNPNTIRTYRRGISVFFSWAVRHHFCSENPCSRLDRPPQDTSKISILSPDEIKRLLTAAMRYADGVTASCVAIALFAGLRPSEIEELRPEDILRDRIRIRYIGKRRQIRRAPPIPENLNVWLKRFPFKGLPAGWERKRKNLKKATEAARWVSDILRHTSISYQLERNKDAALTAYQCGTSQRMIEQHYREVIDDPDVVKAFWKLTPKSVLAENLEVKLPSRKRIKWPADKQLAKMVAEKAMTVVARELDVSDVAVRKHCIRQHIPMPTPHRYARDRGNRTSSEVADEASPV